MKIEIIQASLTQQNDVDAIVNPIDSDLKLSVGVSASIHAAAGQALQSHCKHHTESDWRQGFVTPAFNLPNQWIIHIQTQHPFLRRKTHLPYTQTLLSILRLAREYHISSLALPLIGTDIGANKSPQFDSALGHIASTLIESEADNPNLKLVRICRAEPPYLKPRFLQGFCGTCGFVWK